MDTKRYGLQDMAKVDCGGCMGCSDCCEGMGDTIRIDPYDAYLLSEHLNLSFEGMLEQGFLSLHVEEGVILPNLSMSDQDRCIFLDDKGRCAIHESRPGLCRLFPLGREYEEDKLSYFLLDSCKKSDKVKMKVEKWLGVVQPKRYEAFLIRWHRYVKTFRENASRLILEENGESLLKRQNLQFLQTFYFTPYGEDFYGEFESRIQYAEEAAK